MYEIKDHDKSLKKAQQSEYDDDWVPVTYKKRLQERMETMQNSLRDLKINHLDLWCTNLIVKL